MPSARDRVGLALCLLSAAGFGVMAIIAKQAYAEGLAVGTLLAWRFVIAAAALWAIVAWRRPAWPARRTLLAGLGLGLAGYSAQAGLFFSSLEHIDASLASLLLYLYPALVCCAAVALGRERLTRRTAGALVVASAGTALVLLGGGTGALDGLGVALAVGAAIAYTAYLLVADGVLGRADPFVLSALITTGAAITLVAWGAGPGTLETGVSTDGWLLIVAIAFASTVLPISTLLLGMRRVGASTASIVSTVEPVVTVSLAMVLFGDALGVVQLAGGALVLAAVVVLQLPARGQRGVESRPRWSSARRSSTAPG